MAYINGIPTQTLKKYTDIAQHFSAKKFVWMRVAFDKIKIDYDPPPHRKIMKNATQLVLN